MRTVEHWWNGTFGTLFRRDVSLRVDDSGQWSLRVRWWRYEKDLDYASEAGARAELALLLSEEGPWKRVS